MLSVAKEFDDGRARTVSDINRDVVMMWDSILHKGWRPPSMNINKEYFNKLKTSSKPSPERAFYGTACSFGGYMLAGFYKRHGADEYSGWNQITAMKPRLTNIKLKCCSYDTYKPQGCLIYCDPPYQSTKKSCKYNNLVFNNTKFWDVMRTWSKNNLVFISEERAPRDFVCVWSKSVPRHSNPFVSKHSNDKLFLCINV
jgi:DNA adenine methylase